jgi:hypothetical protein
VLPTLPVLPPPTLPTHPLALPVTGREAVKI